MSTAVKWVAVIALMALLGQWRVPALWPNAVWTGPTKVVFVEATEMRLPEKRRHHWQKNLRLTGALLVTWFAVTFVLTFFARDLNFMFFGWPFSFWTGAQGAVVVYVIIIACYAHFMNKLDTECGLSEADEE